MRQAIEAALPGRTVILVAHRLSTLRHADRVVVFEGGRVVEVGAYEELVRRGGAFSALVRCAGDDLMSLLLQGQAEGRLTDEEATSQCILLLNAGHLATMDQFGNTVLALLEHPGQLGRLRDDPALVRSAVEEGLRYDGTAQLLQRIAREDLTLRGQTIRQGDLLYLSLGAANRDPEVFAEPDRFDIGRADNRHLAFGAGPHLCLGMTLARRELEVALGRLVRRLPRLRFDGEPPRRRSDSLVLRGLESLPVRFDS